MNAEDYSWTGEEEGDSTYKKRIGKIVEDSGSNEENTPHGKSASSSTDWRNSDLFGK